MVKFCAYLVLSYYLEKLLIKLIQAICSKNHFGLSGNELKIYAMTVIIISTKFPPEFCLVNSKISDDGKRVKLNFDSFKNFLQISLVCFLIELDFKFLRFNMTHKIKF